MSASRRTDIPAFYTPWFLRRLQAGFCHWINPYGGQVKRVSLQPEDCLAIAFWTRNPAPLLPHLPALRRAGYHCYFHYTINGYPRAIESHNPPLGAAVDTFRRLAATLSPDLVHWRYDPIVLSDATPVDYHLTRFAALARQLEGHTRRCYFSFVDFYGKTERNLGRVEREQGVRFAHPDLAEQRQLTRGLRDIAAARGITLYSCCNDGLLGEGVERSRCIDLDTIALLRPDLPLAVRAASTRQDCGCVECDDIGAYDTCAFGCACCYATNSRAAALQRRADHDPEDTVLWRPLPLRGVDLATREVRPKAKLSSGGWGTQLPLFGEETPG